MNTTVDHVIIDTYVRFAVPADRIVADPNMATSFAEEVNSSLPGDVNYTVDKINWRLLALRKRGEAKGGLPRLQRAYYGRN